MTRVLPQLDVYIGVDSGSTTSKVALVGIDGEVYALCYAHNQGDPVATVRRELLSLQDEARRAGWSLRVAGLATTGYGEHMLACALGADASCVETVAHAKACVAYVPDATFILDIGGQDMKAIWLKNGVITNVVLNEACSAGCGSFLENFADNLGISVNRIAEAAFASKSPAQLGSRCTVFMTSTIINEQRNGKCDADIVAGLCRSIIENVFTKVVRVSNFDELGDRIVVQGGTFRNAAVLRALEEYVGKKVTLSPYPGEMGAIGAALYAMESQAKASAAGDAFSRFIGFDELRALSWENQSGVVCDRCANVCARTITRFSTGECFTVGNRCARGEALSDERRGAPVGGGLSQRERARKRPAVDLFQTRRDLLFKEYHVEPVRSARGGRIGLPRVLEFWDSMPFWTTFLRALGYEVVLSHPTSQKSFEKGLRYVASDTICLPAKIVHGHILDLCERGVDRILFPYVMHLPPEGTDKSSPYTCAIVMGYPMVVRNFQNPEAAYGVAFETPVFHWFSEKNRVDQICAWARSALGATQREAKEAFEQGERAILDFRQSLVRSGGSVLRDVHASGSKAVVLAGRPYHTDPFVSHGISRMFAEAGIPVLTADSLPRQHEVPLADVLVEITNNFHTRMLESALIAANDPSLEYAQIVSFGCGHDAILSDEITRILETVGNKHPLILKVDESEAQGSIAIRVRSFMETMKG